jgi:sugar phosphate isomerase/epimerase
MKRRTFLKTTAAAGVAATLSQPLLAIPNLIPQDSKYKDTIGLQLWTVRNQMAEDKKATLKAIADAGYKQVELGDTNTAAELIPICKDLGMNVTSSFLNWAAICTPGAKDVPTLDKVLEEAKAAELKHLVFGYINKENRATADHYKKHAETANKFGEKCNAAGIKLCYHNHSFEFEKIEGEKTGFDLLMELFDNDCCKFELDVFWAKLGGWDPIETLNKLDGRVTQVHLKDLIKDAEICYDEGKVPHEAFKELGNGTIDMAEIMTVSEKIGVEQCHVEQDQSPDPIVSIGQSMTHLKTL